MRWLEEDVHSRAGIHEAQRPGAIFGVRDREQIGAAGPETAEYFLMRAAVVPNVFHDVGRQDDVKSIGWKVHQLQIDVVHPGLRFDTERQLRKVLASGDVRERADAGGAYRAECVGVPDLDFFLRARQPNESGSFAGELPVQHRDQRVSEIPLAIGATAGFARQGFPQYVDAVMAAQFDIRHVEEQAARAPADATVCLSPRKTPVLTDALGVQAVSQAVRPSDQGQQEIDGQPTLRVFRKQALKQQLHRAHDRCPACRRSAEHPERIKALSSAARETLHASTALAINAATAIGQWNNAGSRSNAAATSSAGRAHATGSATPFLRSVPRSPTTSAVRGALT